ncbi:MAG: B12-binding domain-containing radical SAM protein [Desulfobacterales bacterium]|nr:B12-binding domain-containing radical SAM protein [Desulfobacterales bacterium]
MKNHQGDIILIQPKSGKYDLFIVDKPLGLLYLSRLLEANGYRVNIVDQRIEENTHDRLKKLVEQKPLWIGITAMTGEPIKHALELANFVKLHTHAPVVWGGIHPTILPEQTLQNENVDYVIRGKGERSALYFSEYLLNKRNVKDVPGLTYMDGETICHNPEDNECDWGEMPMVNYELIPIHKYWRIGFEKKIFSIMTSRNCPYKCTFCYNSSLKKSKPWLPDSVSYVKRHLDYIIRKYQPEYLSFIDDNFFVDIDRAYEILSFLDGKIPQMKIGFRGARVSDLLRLDDAFFALLERLNTKHINIGVESGSNKILKIIRKGITVDQIIELNRRFKNYPTIIPLYNFFSGIPQETEEDIRLSTRLILQLIKENPHCQISGYHQYTPYPGNELFEDAVKSGFREPKTLSEWGELRFEDNAQHCPWITKQKRLLLDMIYSTVYFVDNKYETYIANHNHLLKILTPLVKVYRKIATIRLKYHITAFPLDIYAKNIIYMLLYKSR